VTVAKTRNIAETKLAVEIAKLGLFLNYIRGIPPPTQK